MKRLRVLLSAYACEPGKGSEPGVGWNWVRQIARFAEVWVITRANNRPVIEKALEKEPLSNVHWVYFDLPRWARFWKKGQRGVHLYYYLWQIGAYRIGKRLHREVKFDLVHHVTLGNYWLPSFLPFLPVPFVWGPVGGGESAPISFYSTYSWRGKVREFLRDLARFISDINPLHKTLANRVSYALATTEQTAIRLKKRLRVRRVDVMPQFAMTLHDICLLNNISETHKPPEKTIRFVSAGRNVPYKGFHLGLMAFAKMLSRYPVNCEYWIINTGPDHRYLHALANRLAITDRVKFLGKLGSLSEVYCAMAKCHVLVHPALHEAFGNVVLEGMSLGKPVICLNLGGPALQVTAETGFKVSGHTPEQAVEEMAQAMLKLAKDPDLRRRMGEAARRRVREAFSWERRGEEIFQIYRKVLNHEYSGQKLPQD